MEGDSLVDIYWFRVPDGYGFHQGHICRRLTC